MKLIYGERRHLAAVLSDEEVKETGLRKVRRLGSNPSAEGKLPNWSDCSRHSCRKEKSWKSYRTTQWR